MKNKSRLYQAIVLFSLSIFGLLFALDARAAWDLNMTSGVTPISHDIFDLHMFAIWVCVGIGIVVYGVMIYSIIHYRKSKGAKSAHFHESTFFEILWTVIPFVLLVFLAIPASMVIMRMEDTKNSDLTIKVTGYQWKWQYEYLDQKIGFFSNLSTPIEQIYGNEPKGPWYLLEVDKPLVVPVHQKIRFLVTSNDVIHSWWIPALGIKRDAIPGFIHEAWANIDKPGIYRGQCAELCGVNHGFMPIVVQAVTQKEFNQWVAQQPKIDASSESGLKSEQPSKTTLPAKSFNELMAVGKTQYGKYCSVCHKLDGTGMPPLFPALKGSSVAVGKSVARHIQLVLTGVPGTAMQSFADQLTDDELAAIVTYERNAWDNNTGDIVQASDVAAVRHTGMKATISTKKNNQTNEVKP